MTESGKWDDNRYSFPSVTLLWELFGSRGKWESPASSVQLRAHSKGWGGLLLPHNGHTPESRKLGSRDRSCELRPEPRFPCRRAGHPHAGPQFEAGSRPFQSLPATCNVNTTHVNLSLSCRLLGLVLGPSFIWQLSVCDAGSGKRRARQ